MNASIDKLVLDSNLAFFLGDNPRKSSPKSMLRHNMMLVIPNEKLEQWSQVVFLIFNQMELWIMGLPEHSEQPERKRIMLVWDEMSATLNAIHDVGYLTQLMRLGRSKNCLVIAACQSLSALQMVMKEEQMQDLISNMPYKVFLDSTTPSTSRMICDMAGKYRKRSESMSKNEHNLPSVQVSYTDEDILTPADLVRLGSSDECILISAESGYSRLKKTPVYADTFYKRRMDRVKVSKTGKK